jgi:hypothetical protein
MEPSRFSKCCFLVTPSRARASGCCPEWRDRIKLDNGERYIIIIKEESAPRSGHP